MVLHSGCSGWGGSSAGNGLLDDSGREAGRPSPLCLLKSGDAPRRRLPPVARGWRPRRTHSESERRHRRRGRGDGGQGGRLPTQLCQARRGGDGTPLRPYYHPSIRTIATACPYCPSLPSVRTVPAYRPSIPSLLTVHTIRTVLLLHAAPPPPSALASGAPLTSLPSRCADGLCSSPRASPSIASRAFCGERRRGRWPVRAGWRWRPSEGSRWWPPTAPRTSRPAGTRWRWPRRRRSCRGWRRSRAWRAVC